MAVVRFFAPVDMTNLGTLAGNVTQRTTTKIVITDGTDQSHFLGQNFLFDGAGNITNGTLTGYENYSSGVLVARVSNFSVPATSASGFIKSGDIEGLLTQALSKNDTITGSAGNDVILSFAFNDSVSGGGGNDRLDLGKGNDTGNGAAGNDTIVGGDGVDKLDGGFGADTLQGGWGKDTITGGAGGDRFKYTQIYDAAPASGDLITDFGTGTDKINLSAIDAIGGGANDAFTFIGSGSFTDKGQLRAVQVGTSTVIYANIYGDNNPEMKIELANFNLANLDGTDFIL